MNYKEHEKIKKFVDTLLKADSSILAEIKYKLLNDKKLEIYEIEYLKSLKYLPSLLKRSSDEK